uniref:Uncharacterized protein n=1 Tax=Arundo donax TaxID=35708 RepID=A0A0A8Y3X1_ARUDO
MRIWKFLLVLIYTRNIRVN